MLQGWLFPCKTSGNNFGRIILTAIDRILPITEKLISIYHTVMRNKENTEFGHMHLSIFYRKILSLGESGVLYKSKYYPWSKIQNIELWHQEWPGYGWVPDQKLLPRARISLSNGCHILLRGDALVKHKTPLFKGFSSAFDELVAHLQKKRREQLRGQNDKNA